jgi:hypothetical protein
MFRVDILAVFSRAVPAARAVSAFPAVSAAPAVSAFPAELPTLLLLAI